MTFSHEVGHNFGAIHDDDTPPSMHDCRSKTYIMSSTGSSEKNLQFSRCSLQNMSSTLSDVRRNIYHNEIEKYLIQGKVFDWNGIIVPG